MRISFELTVEDVVAANLLHYDHSPATRRMRWFFWGIGPVVGAFTLLIVGIQGLKAPNADFGAVGCQMLGGFLAALAITLALPRYARGSLARITRKKFEADRTEGVIGGTCTLEIAGSRLLSRTQHSDAAIEIHCIKDIVEYERYVLVYLTSTQMHVIPTKNVLPEEDYRAFVAELRHAWESNDGAGGRKSAHISEKR